MTARIIPCPNCQVKLRFNGTAKQIGCPKCKAVFGVEPEIDEELDAEEVELEKDSFEQISKLRNVSEPIVFISHSHLDRKFVEEHLKPLLQAHKIHPWWSTDSIQAGDDWLKKIKDGLKYSYSVMVVMSQNAAASSWVRREVAWAFENRPGKIIPVLLNECSIASIHKQLPSIQHADFSMNGCETPNHLGASRVLTTLISQLNNDCKRLESELAQSRESVASLEQQVAFTSQSLGAAQSHIHDGLKFDGNWSGPVRGVEIPFLPLQRRRTPIISIFNLKGGVGKSTLTANLGATLWGELRKRVLLVDLDYQGTLSQACVGSMKLKSLRAQDRGSHRILQDNEVGPKLLGALAEDIVDPKIDFHQGKLIAADEDLYLAESRSMNRWVLGEDSHDVRLRLRTLLHHEHLQNDYDVVLVDCPPRLTTATINALLASDYLIIPTILDELSIEAMPRVLNWMARRKQTLFPNLRILGAVINRTRQSKGLLLWEKEILDTLQGFIDSANVPRFKIFESRIPTFPSTAMSHSFPASDPQVKPRFLDLWKEIQSAMVAHSPVAESAGTGVRR